MYKIVALFRANALAAASYRLRTLISFGWLMLSAVPLYFVSDALQPVVADAIATEGGEYFTFLLVGMIAISFLTTAVNAIPNALSGSIGSGLLEALLSTSTRLPVVIAGMTGYSFLWTALRAVVLLLAGALLGAHFAWEHTLAAVVILLLIILAYVPVGIVAAAMVLAFRTPGPLPKAVLAISALLGGVYYPTHVIPSWLEDISDFIPLTYGLRALRQTLLEGLPFRAVAFDVLWLTIFVIGLTAVSTMIFSFALKYAKRAGTLSHY